MVTTLAVTHVFVHWVGDLVLMAVGLAFGTGDQLMFGLSTDRVMLFTGKYCTLFTKQRGFYRQFFQLIIFLHCES